LSRPDHPGYRLASGDLREDFRVDFVGDGSIYRMS
jgi:hypothetical protein